MEDCIFDVVEESNECPKLTVSTFNICCMKEKEAITEIFNTILNINPDVLSIQGLTKENCEFVFRIMKQNSYSFSRFDQTGQPREDFEILFAKNAIPILKKTYTPFIKTNQNRGISMYIISAGSSTQHPVDIAIFTGKLEEGSDGNILRKTQIVELNAESSKYSQTPVIFAGDTSIPSWQSFREPKDWFDAWREKGTSQNEKTSLYDRMDQIWFSSRGKRSLKIVEFDRIRVNCSEDIRTGVYARFTIKN